MPYSSTTDKTMQWRTNQRRRPPAAGIDSRQARRSEENLDSLFPPVDRRKERQAGMAPPWPIDSHLHIADGRSPGSNDPIGQFVYQEHNSFFRTRMPKTTHWSVVWSDLMMTMFIFFVVLFVYFSIHPQGVDTKKTGGNISTAVGPGRLGSGGGGGLGGETVPVKTSPDKIFSVSRQTILKENLSDFASVDLAPDTSVRIVLTGDLLFDAGQAELKSQARKSLAKIAEVLRSTPSMINVVGHTDDVPIHSERFPSNWELSMARAGAVARFLIEKMGLPANRFYVTGHASYLPVLLNNSPANRAANRRVEIVITRDLPAEMYVEEPEKMILLQNQQQVSSLPDVRE